nr:unnamed protein product [Spirometra erinaceieuropaei]
MLTITIVLCLAALGFSEENTSCVATGDKCMWTFWTQCCGSSICDLYGPFEGTCVSCLDEGRPCFSSSSCCTKNCYFFKCRKSE